MKEVNYRKFTATHSELYKDGNFTLAHEDHEISYLHRNDKYVKVHTPTPNENYELENIFYISIPSVRNKILFIHITDKTDIPRINEDVKSIMEIKISFEKIKKLPFQRIDISSKEKLTVFIYNDNSDINYLEAYYLAFKMIKEKNKSNKKLKEIFEDFLQKEFKDESLTITPKEGGQGVIVGIP